MAGTNQQEDGVCPICCETAEGNHYGIASCRSCASFFKRCVERAEKFERHPPPPEGQRAVAQCDVRANRNCCKQCRYLLCLEAGMQPSSVQAKRGPTGSQANRRRKNAAEKQQPNGLLRQQASAPVPLSKASSCSNLALMEATSPLNGLPETVSRSQSLEARTTVSQTGLTHSSDSIDSGAPSTSEVINGVCHVRNEANGENDTGHNSEMSDYEEEDDEEARETKAAFRTMRLETHKHLVHCPLCEDGSCKEGLREFTKLIEVFKDSVRHMQLNYSDINMFVNEIRKGIKLREMQPDDLHKLSTVELAGLLFWVEKMGHFKELPETDQINLLKRYSVRKLSLDHFYSASKFTDQAKQRVFVLNNYTFVPSDRTGFEITDDIRQREAKRQAFLETYDRFWVNVIDRFIDLKVGDAEVVFMHYMLMWSPLNSRFVSEATRPLLRSRRSWTIRMMFDYYKERQVENPEIRVGELINLFQEVEIVVDMHCTDVHVAKLFDFFDMTDFWYDKTCYSWINVDRPLEGSMDGQGLLNSFSSLGTSFPRKDSGVLAFAMRANRVDDPCAIMPKLESLEKSVIAYGTCKEAAMEVIPCYSNGKRRAEEDAGDSPPSKMYKPGRSPSEETRPEYFCLQAYSTDNLDDDLAKDLEANYRLTPPFGGRTHGINIPNRHSSF